MENPKNEDSKKRLSYGDDYGQKKPKSKYNDKLWGVELGTRQFDDESIEINKHPSTNLNKYFDSVIDIESLEREIKFNSLLSKSEDISFILENGELKKRDYGKSWDMIRENFLFSEFSITENFSFICSYFRVNECKFFKSLSESRKQELLFFLKNKKND